MTSLNDAVFRNRQYKPNTKGTISLDAFKLQIT